MRRVTLLYNPASGRKRNRRSTQVLAAAEALRARGVDVSVVATTGPGTAGAQARAEVAAGSEIIFACGGDGTVHEVLQGLVHQRTASLGILPLGTANALARHLGIALDPVRAAVQQLGFISRRVPLGHLTCQAGAGETSRYFLLMAGAGADGLLLYKMLAGSKSRWGRWAYYLRAIALYLRSPLPVFRVSTTTSGEQTGSSSRRAVSVMAVRVSDLGGLLRPFGRGGSLTDPRLRLSIACPPPWLSLPLWFGLGGGPFHRWNRLVSVGNADSLAAEALSPTTVHVQADGEWLGSLPMRVSMVPDALWLLTPPPSATSRSVR